MNNAKELLSQIRLYDAHINNKLEDLQHLRDMATKITTSIKPDVVSHGGDNQDKLGACMAKIIDLQGEINDSIDAFVNKKKEVERIIDNVDDADQLKVLHKRYFEFKTWEQIACEMHMSYRNVCYIHGKALQAVNQIMEEETTRLF